MLNTLFQICSLTVAKLTLDENNFELFYCNLSINIWTSTCNFRSYGTKASALFNLPRWCRRANVPKFGLRLHHLSDRTDDKCKMSLKSLVMHFICALWSPAWKGLTSWLSFVVSNCEFVTFPLVSWVRCGTWLYRFLIFAPLLTFTIIIGILLSPDWTSFKYKAIKTIGIGLAVSYHWEKLLRFQIISLYFFKRQW